ncbi:hypothetical protein CORC01_08481 [Colletotrichum orchidophilum]|uniref:Uncharacterized protein n=1 Tax=Colletotrichum orchidophilum TaxID=1209926 RepID=A0A1G4B4L4_9PEZI|nr:uncharacterized protein CORC01_08481 [Colletotrichum orchidophilum]OHE96263.1 hypothetical protein CORC01_08481 [Colletotrichum orchidophilum]
MAPDLALAGCVSTQSAASKNLHDADEVTAWEADVFSANNSCVLAPEITDGSDHIFGEYMRSNVIDSKSCDGVPAFLEVQKVDVATCDPIPKVAGDIWN